MQEVFSVIPEFPMYQIGSMGTVWNRRTDSRQAVSRTQQGDFKVGLVNDDDRFTLSVRVLVAEAFVDRPDEFSDTVIVLNDDKSDVRADNLAWRPRWFAWKYNRQFKVPFPAHYTDLEVRNIDTGFVYKSIIDCGTSEGLLFDDVWQSINLGKPIYPTGAIYEFGEGIR